MNNSKENKEHYIEKDTGHNGGNKREMGGR